LVGSGGPSQRIRSYTERGLKARGIGTVRYPRLVPRDAECAVKLKACTLTNLYNQRPTWLALAHENLDAAVFAAYGWDPATSDDQLLEALLGMSLDRAHRAMPAWVPRITISPS
jgi:hypothetical protein